MKRIEVSCIKKTDSEESHARISDIGGTYKDSFWQIPIGEAIHNIEMGFFGYYVARGGQEVDIIISSHNGHKYLRTKGDDTEANNLLELEACSIQHRK